MNGTMKVCIALVFLCCFCLWGHAELQNVQVGGSIQIWGGWYTPFFEEDLTLHFPAPVPDRPLGPDGLASCIRANDRGHSYAALEQRTRLNFRADLTDNVGAFIELESIDEWGEDFRSNWVTGVDGRADTQDDIEVFQAYIEANEMFGTPLRLRIGRQEMIFGSGWLVGPNEYPDPFTGLSFDAVRATWSTDKLDIDVWWSKLAEFGAVEEDADTDFYGVYGTYKFSEAVALDLYWLWVRDGAAQKDTNGSFIQEFMEDLAGRDDYDVTNLHTVGVRFTGEYAGFDWEVEGAYQFGEADALGALFVPVGQVYGDSDAEWDTWGAHGEVGYTFESVKWSPRLYLGAEYYSGEDNRAVSFWEWLMPSGKPEASVSFNRLFSDYEFDYFLDASSLSNYLGLRAGAEFTLSDALTLGLDVTYMMADEAFRWPAEIRRGWWRFPIAPELAFLDKGGSRDLGWCATILGEYAITEDLTVEAAYSHFFTGEAVDDGVFIDANGTLLVGGTGDDDADYLYFMTTLKF